MNREANALDLIILDTISDDYETYDTIRQEGIPLDSRGNAKYSTDDVRRALKSLIERGYAQAFLLSPHPPYRIAVTFDVAMLDQLWFYISESGRRFVMENT
jgi:hypothetical protein